MGEAAGATTPAASCLQCEEVCAGGRVGSCCGFAAATGL